MTTNGNPGRFVGLLLVHLMLAGCAGGPAMRGDEEVDRATAERLFARIELGATRSDVETLLGSPFWEPFPQEAWYLRPKLGPAESPYAPGAIGITYQGGVVVARELSPQLR